MERHHNAGHKNTRVICWLISLLVLVASPSLVQAAISCGQCHGGGDGLTDVKDVPNAVPSNRTVGTTTPNTGGQFVGNHGTHLPATPAANKCTVCHGTIITTSSHSASGLNKPQIKMVSATMYGTKQFWNVTSVPQFKTCANVSCHFNRTTDTWGTTLAYTASLANRNACSKCHDAAPMTKAHAKHFTAYSTAAGTRMLSCTKCHTDYFAAGTDRMKFQHATSAGRKVAVLPSVGYTGAVGSVLPTDTRTFGTCGTMACHSNGANAITPLAKSISWDTSVNTSTGCDFCHPLANLSSKHQTHAGMIKLANNPLAYNTYTANYYDPTTPVDSYTGTIKYGFGCTNCHPSDLYKHINGQIEVELSNSVTVNPLLKVLDIGSLRKKNAPPGGWTYNFTSKTCANVYCHSSGFGTPAKTTIGWTSNFTGDRCAQCHDNSPSTGAHQSHKIGIHSDDIYNNKVGFLPFSSQGNVAHGISTQSTTISCNICHAATVATSYNKKGNSCSSVACHGAASEPAANVALLDAPQGFKFHVNGKVDVSFKPIKVISKAQIRDTSFTTYSGIWTRTPNNYKVGAGSFDTAKTALSDTMWTAGAPGLGSCANISCHNLRSGQSVTWNQTLQCLDCHSNL